MRALRNLTHRRFERLVAIRPIKKRSKHGHVIWLCRCSCGNMTEVRGCDLLSGNTQSCGCLHKEVVSNLKLGYKHGDATIKKTTKLYWVWSAIKKRCLKQNDKDYKYYGGKGITVCKEWLNYQNFKRWAMSHGYKEGLTIDRINDKGDYKPSNCQWITRAENVKKSNINRTGIKYKVRSI